MSQYRKGKTDLDFTETRDSEWQWHQLGQMQACTSLQTDNHVKALKGYKQKLSINQRNIKQFSLDDRKDICPTVKIPLSIPPPKVFFPELEERSQTDSWLACADLRKAVKRQAVMVVA